MAGIGDLAKRFFEAHVASHPEEGSTLGLREHASRLNDPSREASLSELAQLRVVLRDVDATDPGALDFETRLDLDAVERAARFYARWIEQDGDASSLELATLPNGALQHAVLHAETTGDVEALFARAEAVPHFLAVHAENLRRGGRDGRAPDAAIVAAFVERALPGAAKASAALASDVVARVPAVRDDVRARLADASRAASDAYQRFARFVSDEIAPVARKDVRLGAAEVAFRLIDVMGAAATADELIAHANASLERAHASLVEHVRRAGHSAVKTPEDAREALLAVLAPRVATVADAVALYERHLAAATRFIQERALVPVPENLALALEPLPPGIADGGTLTNWPAPLLDPRGKGHALYAPDPSAHPTVQAKNLAIHEGIPGHYLQSVFWQRSASSPVRFLGVTDDVAMSRGYFGTMMSVEGWAVYMEQLMLAEGFYDEGPEKIFFAFCDAIRAMRVLLDLGLHAQEITEDEAVRLVTRATLMPEGWARSQILRSKRIPLQSLAYLVGAKQIAAVRDGQGRARSSLDFHRTVLRHGPVPPSRLGDAFWP